jgi:glycosyltransferase involved in cell wall biosynthesis
MNPKKKILIFIDWFYPGFKGGGPLISCFNLVQLIAEYYDIHIFTRANDYTEQQKYKEVELNKWIDFQGIAKIYYCDERKLSYQKINKVVKEINPAIIYLNSMFSYYFTIIPIFQHHFSLNNNRKMILVPRGMLMKGKLQFNKNKKSVFLFLFKLFRLQKKLLVQATSKEEKLEIINNLNVTSNQVHLVPNVPSINFLQNYQSAFKKKHQLKIYFASRIAREKNILFIIELLKEIPFPIVFDIFGSIDHEAYWELCKKEINKLPKNIQVNYKESYKPTMIQSLFKTYHTFIFPTFGENYGHVIIEALSLGKPVITTPNVPWIDIENKGAGWIIDLENQKRYVEVLTSIFEMNQSEYDNHSKTAHKYASSHLEKIDYESFYRAFFG